MATVEEERQRGHFNAHELRHNLLHSVCQDRAVSHGLNLAVGDEGIKGKGMDAG